MVFGNNGDSSPSPYKANGSKLDIPVNTLRNSELRGLGVRQSSPRMFRENPGMTRFAVGDGGFGISDN